LQSHGSGELVLSIQETVIDDDPPESVPEAIIIFPTETSTNTSSNQGNAAEETTGGTAGAIEGTHRPVCDNFS